MPAAASAQFPWGRWAANHRSAAVRKREALRLPEKIVPALIIGGGPVGLALAGDLGWRGVECVLIEQSDGSIYQPRMDMVGVRTMEFCRRWRLDRKSVV